MMPKRILLIGELLYDRTISIRAPGRLRSKGRSSDPSVYESVTPESKALGGVFYVGRFLQHLDDIESVEIVALVPTKGEYQKDVQNKIKQFRHLNGIDDVHQVDAGRRSIYVATRYVETFDSGPAEPNLLTGGRERFRVDVGECSTVDSGVWGDVVSEVSEVVSRWHGKRNPDCVMLVDHDLGLFTPSFLIELRKILPQVPIVVYAGRRWFRYPKLLQDCHIVVNAEDVIATLLEMNDFYDEAYLRDDYRFIKCLMALFPRLGSVVSVDAAETNVGIWKSDKNSGLVGEAFKYTLERNEILHRYPVGYRAIIAACFCRSVMKEATVGEWLPQAHEACRYSAHVLMDKLSDDDKRDINGKLTLARGSYTPTTLIVSRTEILLQKLLSDGLILNLNDAKTCLPGIYTLDDGLKQQLKVQFDRLEEKRGPWAIFDEHLSLTVQKLLISGPSSSGKTEVAKAIVRKLGQDPEKSIFSCNPSDHTVTLSEVMQFVRDHNVSILDEIDKMNDGLEIQQQLLNNFNSKKLPAKDWNRGTIIFTCSTPEKEWENAQNKKDFYFRLGPPLSVPSVSERHCLEPIYVFGAKLYESDLRQICLYGLLAIADQSFNQARACFDWAYSLKAVCKGWCVNGAACKDIGLSPKDDWSTPNRIVTIVR